MGEELVRRVRSREAFEFAIYLWDNNMQRSRQLLTLRALTDAWIAGIRAAGHDAKRARVWHGRYPTELDFVIELPCPFGHRTADHRARASVRLLVEDDGWPIIDPDSPCPDCNTEWIEHWLLTCPRCELGDESEEHVWHLDRDNLWSQDRNSAPVGGSVAPLAFVLSEMEHLAAVAEAMWWVNHPDDAVAAYVAKHEDDDGVEIATAIAMGQVGWARKFLADDAAKRVSRATKKQIEQASRPATEPSRDAPKPVQTPESVAQWLRDQGIQPGVTVAAAWALIKGIPGSPSKHSMEAGLSWLKSHPGD